MHRLSIRISDRIANGAILVALCATITGTLFAQPAASQSWTRDNPGTFIYQRDVPTRPAQVVGEPAPPAEVILTGPDSPLNGVMHVAEPLSDLEAGAITGQAPTGLNILLPDAPPSGTDPQAVAGYAGALASSVEAVTQGIVAQTVTQTTALLNDTTAVITSALGKLPTPGSF